MAPDNCLSVQGEDSDLRDEEIGIVDPDAEVLPHEASAKRYFEVARKSNVKYIFGLKLTKLYILL
jgi:hypothetical protein